MTNAKKWIGEPSPWVETMVKEAGKEDKQGSVLTAAKSMLSSRPENPADEAWLRVLVGRFSEDDATKLAAYERAYAVATEHNIRLPRIESGVALVVLYKQANRESDASRVMAELGDSAKDALAAGLERVASGTTTVIGRGLLVVGQYLTEAGRLATTKRASAEDASASTTKAGTPAE